MIKKIIYKLINNPSSLIKISLFKLKIFWKWFHAYYIQKNEIVISRTKWYRNKGDIKLRLKYKLNKNSTVFDIGGYKGNFCQKIIDKFNCRVYLFEPNQTFYNECVKNFKNKKKVQCFNYAIGDKNEYCQLSNDNEASSTKRNLTKLKGNKIQIKKISDVLKKLCVKKIDLMKINIEGGEFDLLFFLIKKKIISKIKNIQIQFHNFIPGAIKKREKIISLLKKTHKNDWCYYFVWENWSLK